MVPIVVTVSFLRLFTLQIDRLIPVSGKEEMTQFGHMFRQKTKKDLADGHLWFSVVNKPVHSRFTR